MTSRREFIADIIRYLTAALLAVFAALLLSKKSVPSVQGQPCTSPGDCAGCSQNGHCPHQPAQMPGR